MMASGSFPAPPLLEVKDLYTYFYTRSGAVRAVNGVSFTIDYGKTLGIVGESGSGKSVLSRTIIDILVRDGSVKNKGEIIFEGRDLRSLTDKQMREVRGRDIAMVFQDPMSSLNPVKKIGSQITEVLRKKIGMGRHDSKLRAIELIDSVGIPDPEKQFGRYPTHLSGGMRQRIAIAVALAGEPKLIIADEPTTALDVTIQSQILDLLLEQQLKRNMALILITHNLGVVANYTDQTAVMYAGKIVETGPTKELIKKPRMPYTEALMKSSPSLDKPPHSKLKTIPGLPPNMINPGKGCSFFPRCFYTQEKCKQEIPNIPTNSRGEHVYRCWYPLQ